ncbi:MAG: GNAT family N-acetyltransferase [Pseudomonadota bacterium]
MSFALHIPQLETERLILRGYDPARDFDRLADFFTSEGSRFFLGPADRYGAWRLACCFVGHWVERGYGLFAIEEKSTGDFTGMVGPWAAETWPEPELAYLLMEDKGGRGYATEAALCARNYIYYDLGWATVASAIEPENTGSIKVAERLGATLDYEHPLPNGGIIHYYRHPGPEALQ